MRSPIGIREGTDPDLSFEGWTESDPLPEYDDHIHGVRLARPSDDEVFKANEEQPPLGIQSRRPFHPSFGDSSVVEVFVPPRMGVVHRDILPTGQGETVEQLEPQMDSTNSDPQQNEMGVINSSSQSLRSHGENRSVIAPVSLVPNQEAPSGGDGDFPQLGRTCRIKGAGIHDKPGISRSKPSSDALSSACSDDGSIFVSFDCKWGSGL